MITEDRIQTLTGATVYGSDGDKIGKVDDVYLDDQTNRPEWLAVSTGWFGSKVSFVPMNAAEMRTDNEIVVPYTKDKVKNAPNYDVDAHLSAGEEEQLYRYYGLQYAGTAGTYDTLGTETAATTGRTTAVTTDTTTAGRTTGRETAATSGDDAMTRSEERLRVGTENVETGRARLRKYVVTENVTQTVPVRKEEVRIEREPITDANRDQALSGPEITESEHEVILHEERPVAAKETVPVERVRLTKEEHTGEETISDEVRKERIDTEGVYPVESRTVERERTDRR